MTPQVFEKLSGAGNTFALASAEAWETQNMKTDDLTRLVRKICSPTLGISADGVLFLKKGRGPEEFIWQFFNADGSTAEMCGNAARCAAHYILSQPGSPRSIELVFQTGAGEVRVTQRGEFIYAAQMTRAQIFSPRKSVQVAEGTFLGAWIDSGVPHFVIDRTGAPELSLKTCRELRTHKDFGPSGANITVLRRRPEKLEAVTYERGVENYTLACGTGAVAAALSVDQAGSSSTIKVEMPGGVLSVELSGDRPILVGPATKLGTYEPSKEFFDAKI